MTSPAESYVYPELVRGLVAALNETAKTVRLAVENARHVAVAIVRERQVVGRAAGLQRCGYRRCEPVGVVVGESRSVAERSVDSW